MLRVAVILAVAALAGCGASTNVVRDGADGYRVTATGDTGATPAPKLQERVYAEATATCGAKGQAVETIALDSTAAHPMGGFPTATLTFRCVARSE